MISAAAFGALFILLGIIFSASGAGGNPGTFTLQAANMHRSGDIHTLDAIGEFTEIQTRTTPAGSGTVTFEITRGIGLVSFLLPNQNRDNSVSVPSGQSAMLVLNRHETTGMFHFTRPWHEHRRIEIEVRSGNLRMQTIRVRIVLDEDALRFEYDLQSNAAGAWQSVPHASVTNILNPLVNYRMVFRLSYLGQTYLNTLQLRAGQTFPAVNSQIFLPNGDQMTHGMVFTATNVQFTLFGVLEPMRFRTSIEFAGVHYEHYFTVSFVA